MTEVVAQPAQTPVYPAQQQLPASGCSPPGTLVVAWFLAVFCEETVVMSPLNSVLSSTLLTISSTDIPSIPTFGSSTGVEWVSSKVL
ncbi:hypothetical protein E2C01_011549 [Portunus trituberculatus]|uniref:Uncharacterized protein n=1 Tax=Portunus trituberculatus TaxID=210409 RepID=A0A5B7DBR0_PORTR|nr:hypothetical protein [Portunus trituberculatus]